MTAQVYMWARVGEAVVGEARHVFDRGWVTQPLSSYIFSEDYIKKILTVLRLYLAIIVLLSTSSPSGLVRGNTGIYLKKPHVFTLEHLSTLCFHSTLPSKLTLKHTHTHTRIHIYAHDLGFWNIRAKGCRRQFFGHPAPLFPSLETMNPWANYLFE